MPKSFVLDGRRLRLSPKVPAHQIRILVGELHVGTADGDVVEMIAKRAASWPNSTRANACNYALYIHRQHQALYRKVTTNA